MQLLDPKTAFVPTTYRRAFLFKVLVVVQLCFLSACAQVTITRGAPLDIGLIERIEPGVTTMSDVMTALGPPEAIIDGTQRVADLDRITYQSPLATRILSAPDGEVILLYLVDANQIEAVNAVGAYIKYSEAVIDKLLIYVSKDDLTVQAVALPKGSA